MAAREIRKALEIKHPRLGAVWYYRRSIAYARQLTEGISPDGTAYL